MLLFFAPTPNPKLKPKTTPNHKPQTTTTKPQTPNPKPQTQNPNPKPQTPNPKPPTRIVIFAQNKQSLIEKKQARKKEEKTVLVGLIQKEQTTEQVTEYLDELSFLAETAGVMEMKRFTQKLPHPDSRTFVGKGKLEEIKSYVTAKDIHLIIFDDELTGSQIANIEKELGIKTIDRSDLILDIFASRARTAQAKVQVELAQYQYLLPRLKGMWKHLERQGGGIGTRGPGETEIETDRRIVKDKISLLAKEAG